MSKKLKAMLKYYSTSTNLLYICFIRFNDAIKANNINPIKIRFQKLSLCVAVFFIFSLHIYMNTYSPYKYYV